VQIAAERRELPESVGGFYRFRRFINGVIRLLMWIFLRVQVKGLAHVPQQGPLIVMINHVNFLDALLPLALIPRDMTAMTKIELMHHVLLGPLLRWYGIFGVKRGQVDRRALRKALRVLRAGKALLLSPEGHRSGHGRLQKARNGIAFIANRTDAMILPMAITGGEHFWENLKRLRTTQVQVVLGTPFQFCKASSAQKVSLDEMTTAAMYQLARLLPPGYRGAYKELANASQSLLCFCDEKVTTYV
jgi:1-acyl-sn-glycerol-3-phosphate acyltransferase